MKTNCVMAAVAVCFAFVMVGCSKQAVVTNENGLSASEISLISAAGLKPTGATKLDNGYLVEGDIFITADELRTIAGNSGTELIVAQTEQYRTTNTVTGLPRTITVRYTGTKSSLSTALTDAVNRYNALGLRITFTKVSASSSANITLQDVTGQSYIASGGFPSGGNPYSLIKFNTTYSTWTSSTLASVVAHEIGHCIGFRHTDYMDRSYSCGGSYYNEGTAGVGAILISGTPSGPDPNSWMLACTNNGINRPFNANDKTALYYVY